MRRSRQGIEDELRRRIRAGIYPPGSRMPSHRELQRELGASSVTLQRAFDRLVEQGYVDPRGAQGTFVAGLLPHRSVIAMVFAEEAGQGGWNRFWSTAKRVAEEWSEGQVRFRLYHLTGQRTDSAGHRRLCRDLADGGLAGIVFINTPFYLAGSPVFSSPIPRVCLGGGGAREIATYGYSCVSLSEGDVSDRIVRSFQASGRRRIAALSNLNVNHELYAAYLPLLRGLGMESRPEWWLGLPIDPVGAVSARTVTHLLLSGPERLRPDGLLIADDNLVPHATAGILDAGIRVPQDLGVVAHANYPGPTMAAVPCLRYGPDMVAQVRAAVAEIAALTAGAKRRIVGVPLDFREGGAAT